MTFSQNLYIDRKQYINTMVDLNFKVSIEEDGSYLAMCRHRNKKGDGGSMITEADTFAELKENIRTTVCNYLDNDYGKEVCLPETPSVAVRFTEEMYPGTNGEAQIVAEKNCTVYKTSPNGVLDKSYSHENVEGLRALVKDAVQKANPNGKKVTLVLEEVLQQ